MSTANADHDHPAHLAHHFDTVEQQFDSAKLGMWVFLATEILMFGGLFCAYAVYRGNHPEVFLYAHHFLDTFWGAFNTVVLLVSSFTMAWGVRAAQLGQKNILVLMLLLTFLGGVGFMVVKAVEYYGKWEHATFAGPWNNAFFNEDGQFVHPDKLEDTVAYGAKKMDKKAHAVAHVDEELGLHDTDAERLVEKETQEEHAEQHEAAEAQDAAVAAAPGPPLPTDHSDFKPAHNGPGGLSDMFMEDGAAPEAFVAAAAASAAGHTFVTWEDLDNRQKGLVSQFFQIYFMMTGLHGLHVLIGMGLIGWILFRAAMGAFSPAYFTPVDLVGLYWHLVDLIWIFLFPLLYLIH